jgi:methylmalonyl-CoA epimerase
MAIGTLDHIAVVVRNTEQALTLYRDTLGFSVKFSQVLPDQPVRLTHLDVGGIDLQLVEPLTPNHPLHVALDERGEHLHHVCFAVENVETMINGGLAAYGLHARDLRPRSGPNGRAAAFIDPSTTHNVLIELTSDPIAPETDTR